MSSWDKLVEALKDKIYRDNFVSEQINVGLPYQLLELRRHKEWSQSELAERAKMKQSRISQIEDPGYGNFTINTLKRLASAFDIALVVRFVPFGELVDYVTSTPRIVRGLSSESFAIPDFKTELQAIDARQRTNEKAQEKNLEQQLLRGGQRMNSVVPFAAGKPDLIAPNHQRIATAIPFEGRQINEKQAVG